MQHHTSLTLATLFCLALAGCGTSAANEHPHNDQSGGTSWSEPSSTVEDKAATSPEEQPEEPAEEPAPTDEHADTETSNSQTGTDVAPQSFSITPEELEDQIEFIRSCYYNPTSSDTKVVFEGGDGGWEYSRDYRYHNGTLIFAFIYQGTEEHRLYFKDNHMIRYIDENMVVYDYGQLDQFAWWEQRALDEGLANAPA